ncbi:response regulator receiver [Desulfurispirillum indicum S5]|uniref:Response regulator receiver n=1 Tax=Desulfurispirillum indicum (strain ATCC BAA-1389 / DSM 22839 / S5) TaxID=653733 RepID=E6W078_DESIS|nr:response regulator [Desulfurispirillum indicum]ADU65204.1 response regulator receiver [Desulfurispirillum indicum S5]
METAPNFSELKILYVEDEAVIRKALEKPLSRRVKNLYIAANGQEGLDMFREHRPDIVVTDINMPVMDGFRMIELIREINPEVPVIITTALNEEHHISQMTAINVNSYIIKPIDIRELLQRVHDALHGTQSQAHAEGEDEVLVIGPQTPQQKVLPSLYQFLKKHRVFGEEITNREIFSDRKLLERCIAAVRKLQQSGRIMFLDKNLIPVLDHSSPVAPCNKSLLEMENYLRSQVKAPTDNPATAEQGSTNGTT